MANIKKIPLNDPSATMASTTLGDDVVFLPPDGGVSGQAISQWVKDWWGWAVSNGMPTGALQTAPGGDQIYFVGGSWGGDVTGAFTVTAGTPLLVNIFSLLMTGLQHTTYTDPSGSVVWGKGPDPKSLATGNHAALAGIADAWKGAVTDLYLKVTDETTHTTVTASNLLNDYVQTNTFKLDLSAFGYSNPGPGLTGCDAMGYYSVVENLKAGHTYTLDFGGAQKAFEYQGPHDAFAVHITDTVTVV